MNDGISGNGPTFKNIFFGKWKNHKNEFKPNLVLNDNNT